MAGAAVDRAPDGAMDRTELRSAGHSGERDADRLLSRLYSYADRARLMARAGAHRSDAGPAAERLAGDHDPLHAVAGVYLGRGDQQFVPPRRQPDPAGAVGDFAAGDHRRANPAAVAT